MQLLDGDIFDVVDIYTLRCHKPHLIQVMMVSLMLKLDISEVQYCIFTWILAAVIIGKSWVEFV